MKSKILLLVISILFVYCSAANTNSEYEIVKRVESFSGKSIKDSDITMHSHKDKGLISVSGEKEKFFFLIPYAEDWQVKYSDNSIVQLRSDSKNLIASITIEASNSIVAPEKFLLELKSRVESRIGIPLQDSRILPCPTNKILAYFIEVKSQDEMVKSDNFWSIRQRPDNVIIKFHISTFNVPAKKIREMEKTLPILMDSGFKVVTEASPK